MHLPNYKLLQLNQQRMISVKSRSVHLHFFITQDDNETMEATTMHDHDHDDGHGDMGHSMPVSMCVCAVQCLCFDSRYLKAEPL